ncbi:MAG: glycosyltransferase family 2 protein [Chthoniobacteraceae bacterium]
MSVLIPAYNEELLLGETLNSVHASFAALGIARSDYEIIVCDNNSTDGTARVAEAHGAQVVFEPHNQISKARNAAAARAQHPWLIFLDADTVLNLALLRATLDAFASGQVCGGGSLVQFDRPLYNDFANALLLACWNKISAGLTLAAGSYIFCLRSAWEDIGGFEEGVYAGEEIYFSRKVKSWGRKRRLRFVVLSETPIVTPARKIQW